MLRISTYLRAIAGQSPAPRAAKPGSTRAPVVIWNVLRRCNLTCKHCYSTSADIDFKGELDTAEALDVIADGKPKTLEFGVADETAWKAGLSCGGTIRVYVEKVE